MEGISLVFLIGSIIFGIVNKINVGIVSIAFSLILAIIGGIPLKQVYLGFPTQLFVTLLGTMFFFSMLQNNKTLNVFSEFVVYLIGNKLYLLPIVVYILAYTLSAVGPGAIPVLPIAIIIAVTLSKQMNLSPVLMGGLATLGAVGGTLSPIALTGIIVEGILSEQGLSGMGRALFIKGAVVNLACAAMLYFFYKGYKINNKTGNFTENKEFRGFNKQQKISLLLLVVLIILVIGFKLDVGLVRFLMALGLLIFKSGNEKESLTSIPWGVMIMVCGVNVLMTLTQKLGGVKLLANFLAMFMSESTATPIMALTGGIMSQFSSANGVVIPTLVPTAVDIVNSIGGITNVNEITFAITFAAVVTLSPLSTAGSLIMATYIQGEVEGEKKANKLFVDLFIWTFIMLLFFAVLCWLGYYRWF